MVGADREGGSVSGLRRRRLAAITIEPNELEHPENRRWLIEALTMIACELEKGEHRTSLVLEVLESEARYQTRQAVEVTP